MRDEVEFGTAMAGGVTALPLFSMRAAIPSQPALHYGQGILLAQENSSPRQRSAKRSPRQSKSRPREIISATAHQPGMHYAPPVGAAADEYAANEPPLTEPPPSYNEAVAWTPPVHLDTAHSLVLPRDTKPSTPAKRVRPRSSVEVSSVPGPSTAAPTTRHSHYDGLTKQRTRPLSAVTTVTANEQVLPLPRATLSRQNSQRSKATTSTSVQTTVTARTPKSTPSKRPAPRETSSAPPATVPAAESTMSLPAAALSAADVSTSALPEKPKRRPLPPIPTDPAVGPAQEEILPPLHPNLTELDILIARIELEPDCNDLTLLNDFLGNAKPAVTISQLDLPEGTVEVQRRRVTTDGRVKLKLALMGTSVDRCGACLAQFRADDRAVLIQPCSHTVHSDCVRKWIARSATCPQCRHSLVQPEPQPGSTS